MKKKMCRGIETKHILSQRTSARKIKSTFSIYTEVYKKKNKASQIQIHRLFFSPRETVDSVSVKINKFSLWNIRSTSPQTARNALLGISFLIVSLTITTKVVVFLSVCEKAIVFHCDLDHYISYLFSNIITGIPFPHNKFFDQTKLNAFGDEKLSVTKIIISVFDREENIVGKGEIACTSNFSFSHNVFKRLLSKRHQKVSL